MRQRFGSTRSKGIFPSDLAMTLLLTYNDRLYGLNVKDDTRFIPAIGALYGGFVPGDRLDSAAQGMPLRVVGFAGSAASQVYLRKDFKFKLVKKEVFSIEQENELI